MDNEKIVNILNELLTKNYDAERGYKEAAEKVQNISLKGYFENQSKNRYDFGHEIKSLISKYGGQPNKGTSVVGDLHRVWISIRDTFASGDQSIYDECIRGEEAFSEEYGDILADEILPLDVRETVVKQKLSVDKALASLKVMEGFTS